jgi:hypothetical protein
MLRLSTGLQNLMINLWSANQTAPFTAFFINIYSGSRPTSPDDAHSQTLLATISIDGAGTPLVFEASPTAGVLEKGAGVWKEDAALAAGTASWFRLYANGDDPTAASTTAKRVDGTVGTTNADLNLNSTAISLGAPITVTTAQFTLPTENA